MTYIQNEIHDRQRGTVAVLAVFMLVLLLGFAALAVDTMVIGTARQQLGTAADAAALAGAMELATQRRIHAVSDLSPEIQAANTQAAALAQSNRVLNQTPVIMTNPANNLDGDIVVGYLDPQGATNQPLAVTPALQSSFNSVQVTASRSSDHGGLVPSFFAQVLGFHGTAVRVQSTASAITYQVKGFKTTPMGTTTLIPIALSLTTYNAMLSNLTTDNYTANPTDHTVSSGSDGIYESTLYPVNSGAGNWGTVNIGVSNNSTSFINGQISNGVSTSDIANTFGSLMQLNPTVTLGGNPGISLGMKDALTSIVGKDVTIPIYDPALSGGNGNNFQYGIVKFAAVTVLGFTAAGVHSYLLVQPAYSYDPTAIPGDPETSWTTGGLVRVSLTR